MEGVTPFLARTPGGAPLPVSEPDPLTNLKRLIWLYFWLLLFEGALRKWILPQLAGPLLVVRDPLLLLCYAEALRQRRFVTNGFVIWMAILGAVSFVISTLQIALGSSPSTMVITVFGLRANFLHLPLIFIIAATFNRRDIEAAGKWLIVVAPLMAILVFLQFRAPANAWINTGAGLGSSQITVAVGGFEKIRPAGLFSYSTGLASYMSLLAAFVLYDFINERVYPRLLSIAGAASLIVMVPLAVSRTSMIAVSLVCLGAITCGLLKPVLLRKSLKVAAVAALAWVAFATLTVLKEGMTILSSRFEEAGGVWVGIGERFMDSLMGAITIATSIPLFGSGLGMGTNAAAGLLTGQRAFLLAEGEWMRAVLEMGPVIGLAYIGLRAVLVWRLGTSALACLQRVDTLPFLLFSATASSLLNGQFGQPTALGFAVVGSALCLGATQTSQQEPTTTPTSKPLETVQRGRSNYAERLHGDESFSPGA